MNPHKIFVVAGMPRVGTTFLYHFLQQHPEIVLPATKELNFFSLHYEKGMDHYFNLFPSDRGSRWSGDISPIYFMDPEAPARIREALPGVRVILGVRQPSDWVVSFHNQLTTHSRHPPSIQDVCKGFEWEIENMRIPTAVGPGFIPDRIQHLAETFGNDLLVYTHGFLREDPLGLLKAIEGFLGLPAYFNEENFQNQYINASARKNLRWVSYLLRQPAIANLLRALLPADTIRKARGTWESMVAPKALPKQNSQEESRNLISEIMVGDDAWVRELLADSHSLGGTQLLEIAKAKGLLNGPEVESARL